MRPRLAFRAAALARGITLAALFAASANPSSSGSRPRAGEDAAVARAHYLEALEAERTGDPAAALSLFGLAFRHDPGSRDLCFLYLERLKNAGAVDSAVAVGGACAALAGDSSGPAALTFAEHKLLGEVALRADDAPSALRRYRAALDAAGGGDDDGDVLYVLAGLYEEKEDWEAYADVVERLLPRLDYPPRLMDRLARAYGRLNRSDAFIPALRAAWDRTARPAYGQALAALYDSRGLHLSLLKVARRLAVLQPAPEHEWLLARAYAAADRPDSALAVAGRLLKDQPDHPGLRYLHASLLFERGQYKQALREAEELAKEFPEIAAHHFLSGSAALELRKRGARASLEKALALAPLSPETRARLAYADLVFGEREPLRTAARLAYGAGDSLDAEQALLLEGVAHGMLARDLEPRGAWERPSAFSDTALSRAHRLRAAGRFEAILARNSGHRAALFEAGAHLERLGETERAKALLRRLIARDTSHALAMNYLAYTLIEEDTLAAGELEEAGRLLARALALDPENGAFLDSRGWWHFRRGEPDSARVWLERAAEAVPGDPAVLEHLVQAIYAQDRAPDRRAEACAAWHRLMRLDPGRKLFLHCPADAAAPKKK